ncbi:MAG: hypothetical protein FD123_2380 [Bacteroidetes bacterium]|nr:MAG: hypothetical protein FD123_2380 [Bacteroidota bacterium]
MKKLLLTFGMLCPFLAPATILNVPGNYSTIQAAVNAAVAGDTVLVEPGMYFENIRFTGQDILLTSRYYLNSDTSFISSTIINGSQPQNPDTASCILVTNGETSDCVIQGFTITGGAGTIWLDVHGAGTFREGGGILTEFASPTIRFNIIRDNPVTDNNGVNATGGGGIRCGDGDPLIANNVICRNQGEYGAGIVMNYCTGKIVNNLIVNNTGGQAFGGAGVWCTGTNTMTVVKLVNNTIAYNDAVGSGTYGGKGGAVFVFSVRVDSYNNIIWGNTQTAGGPLAAFMGGQIPARYSDIQGGYTGVGNINVDPMFSDTMCFHLDSLSPCVDAGDTLITDRTTDSINPAPPALGTLRSDMGCYGGFDEYVLPCCPAVSGVGMVALENRKIWSAYPNPAANGTFTLYNSSAKPETVTVIVRDMLGKTVFEKRTTESKIQVPVSAWPAGVYSWQVTGNENRQEQGRVMITK